MPTPIFLTSFNAVSTASATCTKTSFSAAGGLRRHLEVWICAEVTGGNISTVTWGGTSLTKRNSSLTSLGWEISKWYMAEATRNFDTAGDVVATFTGTSPTYISMVGLVHRDVLQSNPYRNASQTSTNAGSGTNPSTSVASAVGDIVTLANFSGSGIADLLTQAVDSPGTERDEGGVGPLFFEILLTAGTWAGAASVTTAFTITTSNSINLMLGDSLQGDAAVPSIAWTKA